MASIEADREAALADIYAALQHVVIEALDGYTVAEILSMWQIHRVATVIQYSTWLTTQYHVLANMTQSRRNDWASGDWQTDSNRNGWIPDRGRDIYHDISRIPGISGTVARALTNCCAEGRAARPKRETSGRLPVGLVAKLKSFIPLIKGVGGGGVTQQLKALKDEQ